MKNKYLKTVGSALIAGAFLFIAFGSGDSESEKNSSTSNEPKKKIKCFMCGKDLTDDYNRISPNYNEIYYCTAPCYQKLKSEVSDDLEMQGYKRIDN
jgi:DNA-directed RNA polymerase subunit N (RpoN/RPB10)